MNGVIPELEQKITQLIEEFNFHPLTAKIYLKYNGKCAYCGMDLLETTVKYYSGVIDRLLPKANYPELEWDESNMILSCLSCSDLKGDYDVLEATKKTTPEIINEYQDLLIDQIKYELSNRLQAIENERLRVKQIIRGH